MTYGCLKCASGTLKRTRITHLRRWGDQMVTLSSFAAWRCDSWSYTRYDGAAPAQLEMIFGPDVDHLAETSLWRTHSAGGPGERAPIAGPTRPAIDKRNNAAVSYRVSPGRMSRSWELRIRRN